MARPGELGNLTLAAEDARAQWGWTRLEQAGQDLRYAVRTLRKSPGFTLAAALSLAIGIGANTALFTLTNAVMWKLLPVADPEHLFTIGQQSQGGQSARFSYQQYEIFRDHGRALDLAAYSTVRLDATIDGRVEPTMDAQLVTGEYFPLLGLRPAVGRLFDASDDRAPLAHQVAVLSHVYWQRRFGGDTTVLGRSITLGGLPFTIVGVAPAEFFGTEVGTSPNLYLPVMMQPALLPANGSLLRDPRVGNTWLRVLGRLKAGVPLDQAPVRLNALAGAPETEWRMRNKFTGQFEETRLAVIPAASGLSDLRLQFSQPLFILLGVAGLVLLITCANVGHLMLARSAARRPEFALRLALGAGRARVMRQVLVEGLVLAGFGAVAGVALAYWAAPALVAYATAGQTAVVLDLSPDLRVLAFTLAVSVIAALLFASAPALRVSRTDLGANGGRDLARTRGDGAGRGSQPRVRRRPGGAVGGDPGRRRRVRAHAAESPSRTRAASIPRASSSCASSRAASGQRGAPASPRRSIATYRDLLAHIEAMPGVRSASLARIVAAWSQQPWIRGVAAAGRRSENAARAASSIPRYFSTMGYSDRQRPRLHRRRPAAGRRTGRDRQRAVRARAPQRARTAGRRSRRRRARGLGAA